MPHLIGFFYLAPQEADGKRAKRYIQTAIKICFYKENPMLDAFYNSFAQPLLGKT